MNRFLNGGLALAIIVAILSCQEKAAVWPFKPAPESSIVIIGNSFAEGLQRSNYFEAMLHGSFPDRHLSVRNLGWSADEVNLRPRPLNFGTLEEHIHRQGADVVIACFGMNESFKGPDSLSAFKEDLTTFLNGLRAHSHDGKEPLQVILVSPIAHEALGGFLPDPSGHNESLRAYTSGMRQVAGSLNIPFIDLYTPTKTLMESESEPLTSNGIHLTDRGYRIASELMAVSLDLPVASWPDDTHMAALKDLVATKNQHFFYRHRAQNGEYIYGRRREWAGGGALPAELAELDSMVIRLDSLVWAGADSGSTVPQQAVERVVAFGRDSVAPTAAPVSTRGDLEVAKSQFVLPEGYEIELFASEVDFPLANPVSITFDAQGRLWAATMPSYPHYTPGNPPNDKIIVLEDTDGDGKADAHIVFADSLYLPLGFELGDGGVYLTQAPDFVFLKDTDGDGKADLRQTLLSGFGTEDAHHTLNTYEWGPDGALYMHMGTFLHTQVETPYGPRRGAYGNTWRYEPRTMKFDEYISYPYANPWGNVFMRDGTHLIADVSTGMNYFAPPLTVAIDYPKKHMGMKDFLTSPSKPKTCGMEIISSRAFPDSVQGNVLFNTFLGFQGIRQHKVSESGSGIVGDETTPLLQSKDPNFRPVDLQFGPDGALYVVDWYDPIIQHGEQAFRDPQRDHTRGRIWRITHKGMPTLKPIDMSRLDVVGLLDQLKAPEDRTRYRARRQLREFPAEEVLPVLESWIGRLDASDPQAEQHRLEGLWVHQQFNVPNAGLLEELLASKDHHVRAAATRVLLYWSDRIEDSQGKLIAMSADPSPRVRLEAIAALSHFETEETVQALLAATELPVDDYIGYALGESFKHLKPVWMEMFRKDKRFLADQPEKAYALLRPLASAQELQVPGFITEDPNYRKYGVDPLSAADFEQLTGVVAVKRFREDHPDILEPDTAPPAGPANEATGKERGEVVIRLKALPGKMAFDQETLTVPAGKSVSLLFDNSDQMPHNVVVVKPGNLEKVGVAADAMARLPDGYERQFIPDMPEVLFATPLVNAGEAYQLDFVAPETPGDYPFICTFPGHWQIMQGVLTVN
ncbi:PVC-type heme-binding CxxCH protein [Parapedobacter sp. 10938]|uniref:PVC-type heme-binding CxxCH protein n=1 Tax=Parapedobacter flavus TaxID=3110225 RepID=UPI002DB85E90|nr:PVC-type heme-binding CxxCH protein [Parapedobacter sp. 10938]MEC3878370.1 PVC-type heme-binding CxxCH protein [Parapedobacter sp. 10938]